MTMTKPSRLWPARVAAAALIGLSGLITGCANAMPPSATADANSATPTASNEVASSPDRFGLAAEMPYEEARNVLIQKGWDPHTQGDAPNLNDSTVRELFDLGYGEVKDCSGTGVGACRFEFTNAAGERLVVSTIQNGSGSNQERVVWQWFLEGESDRSQPPGSDAEPPFFGARYFNFYGGNGTGQSIAIELDGATTVEQHGTESSAVLYRGQFSNPLILDDGERLRIEGNTISKISEDGAVISGCNGEGEPCESELYEATASPPILDGSYVLGGTDQGIEVFGDQYRYYDEMGEKEWNPLVELAYAQPGVIFDGENYWCIPHPDETGVCTENGWRSVEERLSEQENGF